MAETLHFSFRTVCDERRVTTVEEVREMQAELLLKAMLLREIAARTPHDGELADMVEAGAMMRAAARFEAEAAAARPPDDPLTVTRHRGDPRERGVQIDIGNFLLDRFGERLDGTAATLTTVALDLPKKRDRKVSRRALSPPKVT